MPDSTHDLTVSLVLGSGGARGHAHIGVIRAIEERGLEIRNIAGTSMGAVIGGVYAAGYLDTYAEWARELHKNDVVKLLDFSFTRTSLFKGERVFDVLRELIGEKKIEDLPRGFTCVATSIDDQREIWLNKGPLFQAIRASTAVPGIFSPVEIDGRSLVDGGLINPIPVAPTLNDATDLTIAVNLNGFSQGYRAPERRARDAGESSNAGYREKIAGFINDLVASEKTEPGSPDAVELLTKSIDVMQGTIARLKLAAYALDKTVEIPRNACSFFEFYRASEMAELGYERTTQVLDELGL
jgi:NTE family protein